MSNVTTEKIKVVKQPDVVKPDVKLETPVVVESTPSVEASKPTIMDRLEKVISKLAGSYDGKYQEEDDGVQGVPGTKGEEKKAEEKQAEGSYDGKYQEEPAEEPDGDEGEDCVCEKCGSTYKAKKAEKKAEAEEEEEEEETMPKKEELSPEKLDLSVDAWRKNFGQEVKPNKAMTTWQEACGALFTGDAFPEKK
jgi:hypothetical protein